MSSFEVFTTLRYQADGSARVRDHHIPLFARHVRRLRDTDAFYASTGKGSAQAAPAGAREGEDWEAAVERVINEAVERARESLSSQEYGCESVDFRVRRVEWPNRCQMEIDGSPFRSRSPSDRFLASLYTARRCHCLSPPVRVTCALPPFRLTVRELMLHRTVHSSVLPQHRIDSLGPFIQDYAPTHLAFPATHPSSA